jgi:hypothetical protein
LPQAAQHPRALPTSHDESDALTKKIRVCTQAVKRGAALAIYRTPAIVNSFARIDEHYDAELYPAVAL